MISVRMICGAKAATMIAFFKAHKRAITLLLVLAWAAVPLIMEQSFDPLSLGVNLIFIASQLFWFRRVGELGKKLIGNKTWRRGLAATGLIVYTFLLIFNLLTWWDASKGSALTLRAALLEAPFRWWLFGSLLGFLLFTLFWIADRVTQAVPWAFKKLSTSQGGDLPSPRQAAAPQADSNRFLCCTLCGRLSMIAKQSRGKEIAMRVLGYTWAGVRTADLKSAARFFADTLGFSVIHKGEGLVQFELPSGQLFEVFGSKSRYYQLHACPVLAFQVEDVRAARKELESRGVEFVTDVDGNESEAWTYFHGPDDYLYELWQTARPLKALPPTSS